MVVSSLSLGCVCFHRTRNWLSSNTRAAGWGHCVCCDRRRRYRANLSRALVRPSPVAALPGLRFLAYESELLLDPCRFAFCDLVQRIPVVPLGCTTLGIQPLGPTRKNLSVGLLGAY